ncbi:hypothetical protein CHARACLAT_025182 [Characodon lateralis]|uniref:Uncharacterized protein n=1 Tax=Characodon lateralis TaxID=208331 RepID=A0ABU7CR18_9TELE|nr:hypothetical protein [Characodon lateralis]
MKAIGSEALMTVRAHRVLQERLLASFCTQQLGLQHHVELSCTFFTLETPSFPRHLQLWFSSERAPAARRAAHIRRQEEEKKQTEFSAAQAGLASFKSSRDGWLLES